MKDYFLNIQDAYRQPIEQFAQTRESFTKVKQGMNVGENSGLEVYAKTFAAASTKEADVYRLGTTTLKLGALPWLAVSAYIIGKVAYTRQFSYKGLLLAGTTFSVGHDLSKMGHNLQRAHVMTSEAVLAEDARRNVGHTLADKQSDFLRDVLVWVVSKPVALKVGAENMEHEVEILSNDSLQGRIVKDATAALKGTVAQDIMVSVNELMVSVNELIFG